MPASLTAVEQNLWADSVKNLRAVGQLRTVNGRGLRRYVRDLARSMEVRAELASLRRLERRLDARATAKADDRQLLHQASAAVRELTYRLSDEHLRLVDASLRFLRSHRLTPRSRMESR